MSLDPISFNYTLDDGAESSELTEVIIDITSRAPIAVSDAYDVSHDVMLSVDLTTGLLANDIDIDTAAALQFKALSTAPAHGIANINLDGSFTYTPDPGFVGLDTFAYIMTDGFADSIAQVFLSVQNIAPTINPAAYTTSRDTPLIVTAPQALFDESADPDAYDTIAADTLNAAVLTDPLFGQLALNPDGTFTYTPDLGFTGDDEFYFTVTDAAGTLDTALAAINVDAPNRLPEGFADDAFDVHITGAVSENLLMDVTDPDHDLVTTILDVAPTRGTLDLLADGRFSYAPNPALASPGQSDFFTVKFDDGHAQTAPITITLNIINAAPVANAITYRSAADTDLIIPARQGVLSNDQDESLADVIAIDQITTFATAAGGSVTLRPDGSFDYTPQSPTYTGTDSFTYTSDDGYTTGNTQTVYIEVTDDYVIANDDAFSTHQKTPLTVSAAHGLLRNDWHTAGAALTAEPTAATPADVVISADGSFTYTPADRFVGAFIFQYQAVNGTDTAIAYATVDVTNFLPVPTDDRFHATHGVNLSVGADIGLIANDYDHDNDPLQIIAVDPSSGDVPVPPAGHAIFTDQGGSVYIFADGGFIYVPPTDPVGAVIATGYTDSFQYKIDDAARIAGPATVIIDVRNSPAIGFGDTFRVHASQVPFDATVADTDYDPEGHDLTYRPQYPQRVRLQPPEPETSGHRRRRPTPRRLDSCLTRSWQA
ncbi:MAG: hypothetical protein CMJ49_12645 [Planctomycetaceae bacterium]|nr:hypothetical protein [Planctomycetaceae bacterium]